MLNRRKVGLHAIRTIQRSEKCDGGAVETQLERVLAGDGARSVRTREDDVACRVDVHRWIRPVARECHERDLESKRGALGRPLTAPSRECAAEVRTDPLEPGRRPELAHQNPPVTGRVLGEELVHGRTGCGCKRTRDNGAWRGRGRTRGGCGALCEILDGWRGGDGWCRWGRRYRHAAATCR